MTMPVEGAQGGAGTEGQGAPGTTDGTGTQGQGAQNDATQNTVSRAEFDQIRSQLSAADQKRQAAENKAKALEDAQLSEAEKQKRDLEAAQVRLTEKDEEIKGLKMDLAFLTDNTHEWHNPKAALALADKSNVKVDDDGKVTGLKEALEAVAKTHPYLLKPKAEENDDNKGGNAQQQGVTGVGGQGSGGNGTRNKADLEKRFPALRGRTS